MAWINCGLDFHMRWLSPSQLSLHQRTKFGGAGLHSQLLGRLRQGGHLRCGVHGQPVKEAEVLSEESKQYQQLSQKACLKLEASLPRHTRNSSQTAFTSSALEELLTDSLQFFARQTSPSRCKKGQPASTRVSIPPEAYWYSLNFGL